MKIPATAILFLLTVGRLVSPYVTTILAQLTPLTCRYTTYCSSLTATMASTGVCSSVAIPVPASITGFPSELIFGFTFTSITPPNWCRLPFAGYFSSILLTPGPYTTRISLTGSVPTSLTSARTYITVLRMLFPAGMLTLILSAATLSFL
jgi:hypothetical protein